jgi:hypothetical protein
MELNAAEERLTNGEVVVPSGFGFGCRTTYYKWCVRCTLRRRALPRPNRGRTN